MKIKPYPIETARHDANKNLALTTIESIATTLNKRIEQFSKEGKEYTTLIYTVWEHLKTKEVFEIENTIINAYQTEGYYINITPIKFTKDCYKIQITCDWKMEDE